MYAKLVACTYFCFSTYINCNAGVAAVGISNRSQKHVFAFPIVKG